MGDYNANYSPPHFDYKDMLEISNIATNLECSKNGIWFSKNRPQISYPDNGYLRSYWVEDVSFWFKHRNRCIIEVIRQFTPVGPIFDVGAGNGFISLAIQKAGYHVVVIEPGLPAAMNAYKRGLKMVICSTLEDAGFKPNLLPAIGLFDVLEHIEDDYNFLKTIRSLLVPNGRLYISVPAYNFLWSINDIQAGHFRRYTLKSLVAKLESVGFKIKLKTYLFRFIPFSIFLFRTIPSRLGLVEQRKTKKIQKAHHLNNGLIGDFLKWMLTEEIKLLRNRKKMLLGGSCLAVAESN